ncbi:AbrB/MazE/SpoVT family DNA-binding domain-containing protein [Candidatus Acetothermia bacterium]|nr:AbrB/MazE/SpoVT family DNA-binding domain-containing protein [Candidatus Acetothermia bacterium]
MPTVKTGRERRIRKIKMNRQVTIPKDIFDDLEWQEGDFAEIKRAKNGVFIAPKKLVDPDDILTPEDEAALREGLAKIRRGETVPWKEVKKWLKL